MLNDTSISSVSTLNVKNLNKQYDRDRNLQSHILESHFPPDIILKP